MCHRTFPIKYSYSRETRCTKMHKKISISIALWRTLRRNRAYVWSERNGESENAFVNPTHAPIHVCVLYKWYHQVPVIFRARRIIPADTCQRHLPVRRNRWSMKILLTPRICLQLLRILLMTMKKKKNKTADKWIEF